jgi:hypothetical protein
MQTANIWSTLPHSPRLHINHMGIKSGVDRIMALAKMLFNARTPPGAPIDRLERWGAAIHDAVPEYQPALKLSHVDRHGAQWQCVRAADRGVAAALRRRNLGRMLGRFKARVPIVGIK